MPRGDAEIRSAQVEGRGIRDGDERVAVKGESAGLLSVRAAGSLERTDELFSLGVLRQGACRFIEFPVRLQTLPQTRVGACGGRRWRRRADGGRQQRQQCRGGPDLWRRPEVPPDEDTPRRHDRTAPHAEDRRSVHLPGRALRGAPPAPTRSP